MKVAGEIIEVGSDERAFKVATEWRTTRTTIPLIWGAVENAAASVLLQC